MKKKSVHALETTEPCQEQQALLSQYQDNELDDAKRAAVATHVSVCSQCRAHLSALEQVSASLRALPEVETNPYFTTQLMARVNQQYRANRRWYFRFALPSLMYSLVFLVFFSLSVWGIGVLSQPTLLPATVDAKPQVQEADFAQVLSQSQQLGLLHVQDHSFDLLTPNGQGTRPAAPAEGE